ncbi:MFS transporter [Streptomyces sp. NPDC005963]|uniref:MFS transporter n=1 Tax=Streptomyces sp. NPDC005963 TaxID=3156721 RepID=UPI0033C5CDE6
MSERTSVSVVLAAGVLAAVSLGKFSPFLDEVRHGFDLSLTAAGWLTSSITVVAAAAATAVGRWSAAERSRPVLAWGLVAIGVSGLLTSVLVEVAWQLYALRLVEAVGYVAIMVAGPSLLAQVKDHAVRRWALALWGMCIPAGLAVAAAVGGLLAGAGWRAWLVTAALASLLLIPLVPWTVSPWNTGSQADDERSDACPPGHPRAAVWLLAGGFALITMVGLAVVTMLPVFLSAEQGLSPGRAGALTSIVAASSILGSVAAGYLLQRGTRSVSLFASALVMPLLGAGIFLAPLWSACFVAAVLLMVVNGIVVATVFAVLPTVSGVAGAARAAGTVTQVGSLGTLLGPPLFGTTRELIGWWAAVPLVLTVALVGVVALSAAVRSSTTPAASEA